MTNSTSINLMATATPAHMEQVDSATCKAHRPRPRITQHDLMATATNSAWCNTCDSTLCDGLAATQRNLMATTTTALKAHHRGYATIDTHASAKHRKYAFVR
jgi:hypothetical protein